MAQIIGAGIFVISGVGVKIAGPGLILAFLLAGAACTLAALCYAELASMMPQAGSAYSYAYGIFGELAAWIIGWDLILEYGMGAATVAAGWSFYLQDLLRAYGLALPHWATGPPFTEPGRVDQPPRRRSGHGLRGPPGLPTPAPTPSSPGVWSSSSWRSSPLSWPWGFFISSPPTGRP